MAEDYMSFEKVLKELQIEEEDLKKLVSAGEIKAFRDADQMKFKREEIEKIKKEKAPAPDVIELLDSDSDLEDAAPTQDSSTDITEELSFDDDELEADVGMATAPISDDDFLSDELSTEEGEEVDLGTLDFESEELGGREAEEQELAPSRGRARVKKSRIVGVQDESEDAVEPQWALGLLIVSSLVLVIGVLVTIDIATSSPSPVVAWLVNMFSS